MSQNPYERSGSADSNGVAGNDHEVTAEDQLQSRDPRTSRGMYEQYRRDLKSHRTEGSKHTAAAHAQQRKAEGKSRRSRSFFVLLKAFFALLGSQKKSVYAALALLTLATCFALAPPYGTKIVFDNVLDGNPLPPLLGETLGIPEGRAQLLAFTAIAVVVFELIALMIGISSRWLTTRTTKRVQVAIRRRVFEHAVRLPLHRVHRLKSGGVASILREDAGGIADLIFAMIYNPWKAIVRLVGSMTILAIVDWRLLIGSLVLLPSVFLTHRAWISRIRPLWRDIRHTRQQIDGQATEAFAGMRVVRTFGRQRNESSRFTRNNHFMARQEILGWWWSRGVDIAWSILIPSAMAGLLWYGGWRVLQDEAAVAAGTKTLAESLTKGDLVMFVAYLMMLLEPLALLAGSATAFQNNLAGLDRVLDLLDESKEFEDTEGDQRLLDRRDVKGAISMHGVAFTYPSSDEPVLTDVDLAVKAGETIALVGPSGAGKTTLCNLVARFYDPSSGSVVLDGVNLRDISVESYRRLLGIVEQDIFLFDGSVTENIGYSRRQATMEELRDAARQANALDFIEKFEDGFDTIIGERGVRLSGGQRQRIAIARALLADPKILILDEATSNLDTESERLIQTSLRTLMKDRTCFVIAHRLSTIADADRIVVVEGGRIVEQGTHDELMKSSGRYREMVDLQLRNMRDVTV